MRVSAPPQDKEGYKDSPLQDEVQSGFAPPLAVIFKSYVVLMTGLV